MFEDCSHLYHRLKEDYEVDLNNFDLRFWNTSNVTNMETMFESAVFLNQPLNNWDTSNVRLGKDEYPANIE